MHCAQAMPVIATTVAAMAIALLAVVFDRQMQLRTVFPDSRLDEAWQRLQQASVHDPLTGLPNRALPADRITQAIAEYEAHKAGLAVLFLNLDDFRSVNQIHGHEAGDQLLVVLSLRLRSGLGPRDTLARLGADEFVVLCRLHALPWAAPCRCASLPRGWKLPPNRPSSMPWAATSCSATTSTNCWTRPASAAATARRKPSDPAPRPGRRRRSGTAPPSRSAVHQRWPMAMAR